MRLLPTAAFISFLSFVLVAGLAARQHADSAAPRERLKAPAKADALRNPYEGQEQAILAGRKLFRYRCTECHGLDARGKDKAFNLRSAWIQRASPGALFWVLKNGKLKEGMPSWSRLPDQQRWQIVTYLKSLGSEK